MTYLKNKNILIVDDDQKLLKLIQNALFDDGFWNVHTATNCEAAICYAKSHHISLFLLDINLPDGNGFSLFKTIREFSEVPIMFITARDAMEDKIHGFNLGADDYIVKPFITSELILRIKALLKRTYSIKYSELGFELHDKYIDFEKAQIIHNGKETPLTPKELVLIQKLWENKNKIVTYDNLCYAAWGEDYYGHENTLMVHIHSLRKKLGDGSTHTHILTIKGLGYKLVIENENSNAQNRG